MTSWTPGTAPIRANARWRALVAKRRPTVEPAYAEQLRRREPEAPAAGPIEDGSQIRSQSSEIPTIRVERRYALLNSAASPTEYLSDARAMFGAVRDMRPLGLEIVAVYHSHPTSPPIPSRTDLERNYSPDVMNFIISLQDGEPQMRGWWLDQNSFREADWRLAD